MLYVLVFVLQKPAFVLCYHVLPEEGAVSAFFNIVLHGLKLDASLAGYLTAVSYTHLRAHETELMNS